MTSYAVIGAGAIGGFYGARLARSGQEVHFLFRGRAQHVDKNGLQIISTEGDFELTELNAYADWSALPRVDVAIVAVKSGANADVASRVATILKPGGAVLLIQNGLGAEPGYSDAIGDAGVVIGGLAFISVVLESPNQIRHFDFGTMTMGQYSSDYAPAGIHPTMQTIADDLAAAGIPSVLEDDLLLARWKKLLWNIPFNSLSVILNAQTDELMGNPATVELVSTIMDEVRAATASDGREIPREAADMLLAATRQMQPYSTSMKVDYQAGRHLEVQGMLGEPLARAERNGLQLPTISTLFKQLTFIDDRQPG